jgi:hypothetical protein
MSLQDVQKQTYNDTLDRMGYFCDICNTETRNANGLVAFQSKESVQALNVCRKCLPEGFE